MVNIKKNRILKFMIGVIIFVCGLLISNSIIAATYTISGASAVLNGKGDIYCIEQGVSLNGKTTFTITDKIEVSDPRLVYILNMTDNERTGFGMEDVKQNMIWYYMNTYKDTNTTDAKKIKDHISNYYNNWPTKSTLNETDLEKYIKKMQSYYDKVTTDSYININNPRIDGNYVKWDISKSDNIDSVNVYVNGVKKGNINKIALSEITIGNDRKITVTAEGYMNKYSASYKVLYNGTSNKVSRPQSLIQIFPNRTPQSINVASSNNETITVDTDVSLQKYITQVNGNNINSRANKKADNSTTSNIYKNSSGAVQGSSGQNKYNDIVSIEAGDYVTYKILVYNNTSITTNNINVIDTLPLGVTKYRIGASGGYTNVNPGSRINLSASNFSLSAYGKKEFIVTLYFGKYETGILTNTAELSCSNNKTSYRTKDEDYVKMQNYAVSLEKYITRVDSNLTTDKSYYLNKYSKILSASNSIQSAIENLITRYNNIKNNFISDNKLNIADRNNYDLDGNGIVDTRNSSNDYTLYNKYKDKTFINPIINNRDIFISSINSYIKCDINSDGKVDNNDLNYFYADINGDYRLNKLDIYAYLLNGNINENFLNTIKIYRSLFDKYQNNLNLNSIKTNVEDYIKSDLNDDGIVNDMDSYVVKENNKISIPISITDENAVEYEDYIVSNNNIVNSIKNDITGVDAISRFIVEENLNIEGSTISQLEEALNQFDINQDGQLTNEDIKVINECINHFSKIEDFLKDEDKIYTFLNAYNSETLSNLSADYDLNEDGSCTDEDYILYSNYLYFKELYDNIVSKEIFENIVSKGLDNRITNSIKNAIETIIKGLKGIPEENELGNEFIDIGYIQAIKVFRGFKEYNSIYNGKLEDYDINSDGIVNNNDLQIINECQNISNELINIIKDEEEYYELIEYFSDILLNSEENRIGKSIIDTISDNCNTFNSKGLNINSYINSNTNIIISDTVTGEEYIRGMINNRTDYDVNCDGVTNQADIDEIYEKEELFNKIKNIKDAGSIETIVNKYDINGDGIWNQDDNDLIAELYELSLDGYKEKTGLMDALNNTSGNGSSSNTDITGREGKRYNNALNDGDKDKNSSKPLNKVQVEPGDIVTYTIKLTNTGNIPVKVTQISDTFTNDSNGLKLEYQSSYGIRGNGNGTISGNTITFNNATLLQSNKSVYVTIKFKVIVPKNLTNTTRELSNKAIINQIKNKNNVVVSDSDGTNNNADMDWVKTKTYAVSLEKYVNKVNHNQVDTNYYRSGKAEYILNKNNKDSKYNDIVNVKNGDKVTYTIKVTNDGDTNIKITKVTDTLPTGVKLENIVYGSTTYNNITVSNNQFEFSGLSNIIIPPGGEISFDVTVTVTEPNMSINILKNTATISDMKNKNDCPVLDTTPNDNTDSDYIQLKGIEPDPGPGPKPDPNTSAYIKGFVWNDIASTKTSDDYDGKYNYNDEIKESKLGGIVVKLFRDNSSTNPVATTTTDANGYYLFQDSTLTANKDKEVEKYVDFIKGSKTSGTNRWESYYSYYVEFEYDGVKYTSARDKNENNIYKAVNSDDDIKNNYSKGSYSENGAWSNACEENYANTNGISRADFNKKFATIDQSGATSENGTRTTITYNTKNEDGYIPQSIHQYNANMTMQSSTNLISMENYNNLNALYDTPLEHVNLGLRGRDIFDLELTSDVDTIKVTVNNQQGVYKYSNKVTLRKSDLTASSTTNEDMANIKRETSNIYVDRQDQNIRTSDLNVANAGTNRIAYGDNQRISDIEVTYKIIVHNASRTAGTATKITNYYDSKYDYKGVILGKNCDEIKNVENGTSGSGYNSKIITVNGKMLGQSETMEIYVVYTLKKPVTTTLQGLTNNNPIPTYNMAEITEYKTQCGSGQTEYTRGLLDKDSAPGSVSSEKVRLAPNTIGTSTTVQYYFGGNNLSKLKYEDDTYATPTLYFVADEAKRKITGTVFEDYTKLINNDGEDQLIRVKTGDGKQIGDEPGIKGITVELYEQTSEGEKLRYSVETDTDGKYTFEGFLPGNYFIKYYYGNTTKTFLLDNNPNTKSYNGEDFQATNNTGLIGKNKYDGLYKLSEMPNYWYAYNESEGISTAIDYEDRRKEVSETVTKFSDDKMTVLNNARDGKGEEESKVNGITVDEIINNTAMKAYTDSMLLTVEETVLNNDSLIQKNSFSEYNVSNMNFGIAEVPVTTIDLQKHVNSFTITDSTGSNILAAIETDLNNTAVTVNPSKIAKNRIDTVVRELSKVLKDTTEDDIRNLIAYNNDGNNLNQNITIKEGLTEKEITDVKTAVTNYSLAREIKIVPAWKVTAGNVKAPPGIHTINVEIEDDKLQGAKIEVTYEISASIYAEKNFNNDSVTVPSIKGVIDYIDNNLSYNEDTLAKGEKKNKGFWTLAEEDKITFGEQGTIWESRNGTLDPDGKTYNTILTVNEGNQILRESCGEGKTYVTLEKVLSSTDMTLQDIITSNVDIYTYQNSVEISKLDYANQEEAGGFVYRDRVRTADRYIILAGRQHDSATSETISIYPPLGDSSINIMYYVIAGISLVILAAGVFGIKKFVLTNRKS